MRLATAVAALALAAATTVPPAFAEEKKAPAPAAKEGAPAPAKEAAPAPAKDGAPAGKEGAAVPAGKEGAKGKQSAWVKLCEKSPLTTKDKDGKEVQNNKDICLTHHERLDGNTGQVLISAAIRQVEGSDKQSLMIMLPLGMALPPGVKAAVYSKEQWQQAAKNEKIDEKALKPVDLKYVLCHNAGCTAEVEATAELLEQMKTGGGMMVLAINTAAKPIGFPVPLEGFSEAYTGKPIDNKEYAKARGNLMGQIRQRQAEIAETVKKERDELQKSAPPGGPKAADAKATDAKAAGAKAADAKAPAPAEKK